MSARIYVMLGQGGGWTSYGMFSLANRLRPYGIVTTHSWDDNGVINSARNRTGKIAIIGYSLGANATAWISSFLTRVDLIVAYDPSRQSPLAHAIADGEYVEHVGSNVKRALSYYNRNGWPFGGARLEGAQVEITPINENHLAVCFDGALHNRTIAAVKAL